MALNLRKGQKIDLTKDNPSLRNLRVGLGWDTKTFDGGVDYDLDASVFLVGANGKSRGDHDFIFYNQLTSIDGAVEHTGDNRTGYGDGDDEVILVDLTKIAADVSKLAFVVTIHDAEARRHNFGQVANSFIRLVNDETDTEILRFDLGEDFSIETAIVFAEIYRHNDQWKFAAIGSGFQGGLAALCHHYGLEVM